MLTYHRPGSLPEACRLLAELGREAQVLAGGTDLVPDMRRGARAPTHLVSLRDLRELREIRHEGGHLRIGALVTPAELADSDRLRSSRPELLDAIEVFGSPQVRNRATLGGNLCTAASCGDLPPLLLALGAAVRIVGPSYGERSIPLEDFFAGPRTTVLARGEILADVVIPVRAPGDGARYEAFGQRAANFITVAGVAAAVSLAGGSCRRARVVLSAVAPTPLLVPRAAEALEGGALDDAVLRAAAAAARQAAAPISDIRGSAEHRRDLVEKLTLRALDVARGRAREDAR